jgi:putative ABC transport system permease protein
VSEVQNATTGFVIERIEPLHLALAIAFLSIALLLSWRLRLGLARSLMVAAARCYVQLLLLGFALLYIFTWDHPAVTLGLLAAMMTFATFTITGRLKKVPHRLFWPALAATATAGTCVTFTVTGLVIGISPWYRSQYVIPLAGMVLGNSMNGIALALERVFSDMDRRFEEVRAMVALGANCWEAALPSIRAALAAALIPTVNAMAAVGIVFIPGMMTGQLLAGADPVRASHYQIVIMMMISAAVALGTILAVLWSYRKAFDPWGAPHPPRSTE